MCLSISVEEVALVSVSDEIMLSLEEIHTKKRTERKYRENRH